MPGYQTNNVIVLLKYYAVLYVTSQLHSCSKEMVVDYKQRPVSTREPLVLIRVSQISVLDI